MLSEMRKEENGREKEAEFLKKLFDVAQWLLAASAFNKVGLCRVGCRVLVFVWLVSMLGGLLLLFNFHCVSIFMMLLLSELSPLVSVSTNLRFAIQFRRRFDMVALISFAPPSSSSSSTGFCFG